MSEGRISIFEQGEEETEEFYEKNFIKTGNVHIT